MGFPQRKDFWRNAVTIADGAGVTFDARGMARMSVIANTGATVTWTRVDSGDASAHGSGAARTITAPAAGALVTIDVDWVYYRVSTAGGTATVAIV